MPRSADLTIPEIRAYLAVRSGLTVTTAADEAGLPVEHVQRVLARIRTARPTTRRGRTR